MTLKKMLTWVWVVLLAGCASMDRGCSSFSARNFGADQVVVQFRTDGTAFNCWKLHNVSVTNEENSDGIYWKDTSTGHLVHISGWYNRNQVSNGDFDSAAQLIGVDSAKCGNGKYPK